MKKFLFSLICMLSIGNGFAQSSRLLINENFTDYEDGNLNSGYSGQGFWKSSSRQGGSDFVQVAHFSPMIYPDYTSGSQYVNVTRKDDYSVLDSPKYPDDPYKIFKNGTVTYNLNNTTFYISFLVRVPVAAGIQSTGNAKPNIAIRTLNGSQFANFYIADSDDGGLKFGIGKDVFSGGKFTTGSYMYNTTYLVLIRYDIANGDATSDYDDKMYLWVNPSLSSEPSALSAQVSIDNFWDFNFDGGFNTPAQSLQLFQDAGSATASFDAFRIAYAQGFTTDTVNAAVAWTELSPAGIPVPLPFKFDNIKGYPKNKSIRLEWTVRSEYDVLKYEVERSNDGIHFSHSAYVAAKGEEGGAAYEWMDPVPCGGNNYYRVKSLYATEAPLYSTIVRIFIKDEGPAFLVYPNPATGNHFSIQATGLAQGRYAVEIFNVAGQPVYRKQINAAGAISETIELPATLQAGIYSIHLTGAWVRLEKQFLVR